MKGRVVYGKERLEIGIFFLLLATLTQAAMSGVAKYVQASVSTFQVILTASVIGLLTLFPIILINEGWRGFKTKRAGFHLIRDLAGACSFLLFFLTINHISLVDAVLLNNTGPLFLPLIIWIWLKHGVPAKAWWGIAIGFIGVILILHPTTEGLNWWMIFGLLSGVLMAVALTALRLLHRTESTFLMLFYYFLVLSLIVLPLAIWQWIPPTPEIWLAMISVGLLFLLLQFMATYAFRFGRATVLAPLLYMVVIWTAIIDWIFWHQIPSLLSSLGTLVVIIGGVLAITLSGEKEQQRT